MLTRTLPGTRPWKYYGERLPTPQDIQRMWTDPRGNVNVGAAFTKYRKGMKDLGRSLVVLAAFQLLVGVLILTLKFEPEILILLGGMIAVHFVLGLLLLRNHGWANYCVAAWA